MQHRMQNTVKCRNAQRNARFALQYKKVTFTNMYTPYKSEFISNLDHMRISGIEPSSVILSQTI